MAERLAGLDLDNAKPDDILNRLTPSEIAQFKAFITTATANNNNNNNNNSNRFYDDNDVVDSSNDGATAESHDQLQKHQQLKRMHSQLINSLVWQPWWYSISDPAKERQRHVSRNLIVDLGPSSSSSSSSCSSNNSSSEPDPSSFRPKLDHQYQSSSNTLPDSLYDKLFANVPISSSFSHNVIGSSSLVPSPWPQPLDSTTISVPPASNLCKSSSSSRVAEPSLLLTHNLIDILFAYVVTLRHFDGSFSLSPQGSSSSSSADPLHHQLQQQQLQELEAAQHILHLSRTLGRNDAASLYPSVEDACASLSSYLSNNNVKRRGRVGGGGGSKSL